MTWAQLGVSNRPVLGNIMIKSSAYSNLFGKGENNVIVGPVSARAASNVGIM